MIISGLATFSDKKDPSCSLLGRDIDARVGGTVNTEL
jgi:hypothetical protein